MRDSFKMKIKNSFVCINYYIILYYKFSLYLNLKNSFAFFFLSSLFFVRMFNWKGYDIDLNGKEFKYFTLEDDQIIQTIFTSLNLPPHRVSSAPQVHIYRGISTFSPTQQICTTVTCINEHLFILWFYFVCLLQVILLCNNLTPSSLCKARNSLFQT